MTTTKQLIPKWAGQFDSFAQWVNHAHVWLRSPGYQPAVCIDAKGRRCSTGKHFMLARDEDAFPVRYFWEFEAVEQSANTGGMPNFCLLIDELLLSWNTGPVLETQAIRDRRINARAELEKAIVAQPAEPKCPCEKCRPITLEDMRMILCPTCGNKRCPHATDHALACTGSNEPGQPGSSHTPAKTDQPPSNSALAWESTTPIFVRYITETRYQKLGPGFQKWYRPICPTCVKVEPVIDAAFAQYEQDLKDRKHGGVAMNQAWHMIREVWEGRKSATQEPAA